MKLLEESEGGSYLPFLSSLPSFLPSLKPQSSFNLPPLSLISPLFHFLSYYNGCDGSFTAHSHLAMQIFCDLGGAEAAKTLEGHFKRAQERVGGPLQQERREGGRSSDTQHRLHSKLSALPIIPTVWYATE